MSPARHKAPPGSAGALRLWLGLGLALATSSHAAGPDHSTGWAHYGGDPGSRQYSALDQVHRGNVDQLQLAWRYDSARGAELPASSELQVNPIVVDGVLYGRNPLHNVFALEADTGRELWAYQADAQYAGMSNMRGVTHWRGRGEDARILFTTGHYLMALDAATGRPVAEFGEDGRVDLRHGLDRDPETVSINVPSPGVIYEDLIILGSAVTESAGAAPGDIRGFNVRSGEHVWSFRTVPAAGEFGADTWPEGARQTHGGANAWAGLSIDVERGIVYAPTGSPAPDFDGSGRRGANLFGNTLLALDAATGERIWHYQTIHHDQWDRDLSSAPTLLDLKKSGETHHLVAQASKEGVIYLLDRLTGEPVWPIPEVPVPGSDIPDSYSYPTQPRVELPEAFARREMGEEDLTNINENAHAHALEQWREAQDFAFMRPPGLQKSVLLPGFYGGANWGGGAYDPESGLYYINAMNAPNIIHMEAVEVNRGSSMGVGEFVFRQHCSGCHGLDLEGFYPYAPPLEAVHETLSKREAMEVVAAGRGRMMPFSHLSRHEREAVVDYLFAFSAGELQEEPADAAVDKETIHVFAGYTDFVDDRYYPAIKPPWGTLNAIDLRSGKRLWEIPLGEYAELTAEGVPQTGTRNFGGPVVTAGGLLIIAATSDEKLRIFDKHTGEQLWEYALPAAGYATPAVYSIDGRQYIVITCSGGKLGTPTGDAYLAFALPGESSDKTP